VGTAAPDAGRERAVGVAAYVARLAVAAILLALFETSIAKMRVFSLFRISRRRPDAGAAGDAVAVRFGEACSMNGLAFDVAHLLAGSLVLVSFMMLYQDRLYALLNVFAVHAGVLALSVAWQAFIQDAPHLYLTR